jgi:threonine aldolase
MLCGGKEMIREARRVRKMLGGGMRQAGIIAAAGIYALSNNLNRLSEDHENARAIANALASTRWARVEPAEIATNIIYFNTPGHNADDVVRALRKQGVLSLSMGPDQIRFVTHLDVSAQDTREIVAAIQSLKP